MVAFRELSRVCKRPLALSQRTWPQERSLTRQTKCEAKQAGEGRPLVLSEWSSAWSFLMAYHDEPDTAAFIIQTVGEMSGIVDISSYWTFTDVFEEGGDTDPKPYLNPLSTAR